MRAVMIKSEFSLPRLMVIAFNNVYSKDYYILTTIIAKQNVAVCMQKMIIESVGT